MAPREAFVVSLAAVGVMALIRAIFKIRSAQVEFRVGGLFAAVGMVGASIGIAIAGLIPESLLPHTVRWLYALGRALDVA